MYMNIICFEASDFLGAIYLLTGILFTVSLTVLSFYYIMNKLFSNTTELKWTFSYPFSLYILIIIFV